MKYLPLILVVFLLASCALQRDNGEYITINGKVSRPGNGLIFLELLTPTGYEKVDSAKVDESNFFILQAKKGGPNIYRINFFNKQKKTIVLEDQRDIYIEADGNSEMGCFSGEGSEALEVITRVDKLQREFEMNRNLVNQKMRTAFAKKENARLDSLRLGYESLELQYKQTLWEIIRRQEGNFTALTLMSEQLDMESNLEFYHEQMQIMQTNLNHWLLERICSQYEKIKMTAIGSIAPNFSLKNPDGMLVSLSSFRGKYVYLDFWASWCQPCRLENPDLLKVYEKYRGQDFEVLGISFDKKKEAWLKAIAQDKLTWAHVSDLKYFDSEMVDLYNIVNVPTTFLLDPEGVIIAKNIHATELAHILKNELHF